jgi:hypothetical protein
MIALLAGMMAFGAIPAQAATPVLVIYAFNQTESMPEGAGAAVADKVASEIRALGGVTVVRPPNTTKPSDYRTVARDAGADFYAFGSIVPVGAGYSAIEQLITTRGGTVKWSVTMSFKTIADVQNEGSRIRDEILRGATPPPAAPSASP